jgi:hypothetical protein
MTAHVTFRDGSITTYEGVTEVEQDANDGYEIRLTRGFDYRGGEFRYEVLRRDRVFKLELFPE